MVEHISSFGTRGEVHWLLLNHRWVHLHSCDAHSWSSEASFVSWWTCLEVTFLHLKRCHSSGSLERWQHRDWSPKSCHDGQPSTELVDRLVTWATVICLLTCSRSRPEACLSSFQSWQLSGVLAYQLQQASLAATTPSAIAGNYSHGQCRHWSCFHQGLHSHCNSHHVDHFWSWSCSTQGHLQLNAVILGDHRRMCSVSCVSQLDVSSFSEDWVGCLCCSWVAGGQDLLWRPSSIHSHLRLSVVNMLLPPQLWIVGESWHWSVSLGAELAAIAARPAAACTPWVSSHFGMKSTHYEGLS